MANSKFHHEEIFRGKDLTKKLAAKKITICGCGALGSNLIETLVRQGFSNLRVIDMDRVETHNLNTQIFEESDVGALKANACQNQMFRAVGIEVEAISQELKAGNIKKLLKDSDLVVDAFDNNASRKLIQDHCRSQKLSCLHAGMEASYGEIVWDDVYQVPLDTDGDICDYPLARNLVMLVVSIAAEEIVNFCLDTKPRRQSWCITLKDLKIGKYK